MKTSSRKTSQFLLILLGCFLILVVALYVSHVLYIKSLSVRNIPNKQAYEKLGLEELVLRLGYIKLPPRKSSFINFIDRPKKKTRIGVFGDSHTFGAEVAERQNYPEHLQSLLGNQFVVINFGMNWYSLDQAFILFDHFYDEMKLDYVILGPGGLYRRRTTSFNHTNDKEPYYLHSRFIIKDKNDARYTLVEKKPFGESFNERFEKYYQFLPTTQYLKYDTRAPGFMRSLEHFLDLKLINPFYYAEDVSREVEMIHSRILEKFIGRAGDKFLFMHNRFEENELAKKINWKSSAHVQLEDLKWEGFPWLAPDGHFTGFGNARVASYASSLVLDHRPSVSKIKVSGDYSDWDDGILAVFLNEKRLGSLSGNIASATHVIGFNCSSQNVGTSLFYPIKNKLKNNDRISGFTKVFSGEWLTVFTGENCLVDYETKELLVNKGFEGDTLRVNGVVLAKEAEELRVNNNKMFIYSFLRPPERIIINKSFGEELFLGKELELIIR